MSWAGDDGYERLLVLVVEYKLATPAILALPLKRNISATIHTVASELFQMYLSSDPLS